MVNNSGPNVATAVTLLDVLPTAVNFADISSSHGTCSEVSCDLGNIDVGSEATITLMVIPEEKGVMNNTVDEGNRVDIVTLKSGDFFGEMALLDNEPRSASVVCVEPCDLFMLDRPAFMNLLQKADTPAVALSIFSALVKRVRETTDRVFVEELTQRMVKAEMEAERHRSLAQMVAGVAHELNTPLGIVNTAVDMIQKRVQSDKITQPLQENKVAQTVLEEMVEASQLATRNIDRAHKLVQNFKKISVNQLTDSVETVNLLRLVLDILELFRINARRAKLKIEVSDQLPLDQKVRVGYPGHLTHVLTNLLFNIERYAYPNQMGGIVKIGLRTEAEPEPKSFVLTVQDFGEGIAPENVSQLFL